MDEEQNGAGTADVAPEDVAVPTEPSTPEQDNTTTRDALDAGVPMLPGQPGEPAGPEDALGAGPTRGDYRDRIGPSGYNPHTSVPVPDAQPGDPTAVLVPQRPLAEEIGDEPGKGGVSRPITAEDAQK